MYLLGGKLIRVGSIIHFWLLNETHFVWLEPLTRSVNNAIDIFLINPNIVSFYVIFITYSCIAKISLISIGLKWTEKKFILPCKPVFWH